MGQTSDHGSEMNIGIFGTGIVGQTLAGALVGKGHDVMIGTRDPQATMQRESARGSSLKDWHTRLCGALGSPMFNFKIVR
jgi:8-hydroxy-5-deazaflavin:NADPH oxidoreductase